MTIKGRNSASASRRIPTPVLQRRLSCCCAASNCELTVTRLKQRLADKEAAVDGHGEAAQHARLVAE